MGDTFRSFDDLKQAHDALLAGRLSADGPAGGGRTEAILAFIDAATGAGVHLLREDQRRSAQDIVEFWTIEMIARGDPGALGMAPMLAEYRAPRKGLADGPAPTRDPGAKPAAPATQSRSVIRVVGLSREWQAKGRLDGYLLKGAALAEAQALQHLDPDIALLVRESEAEAARTERAKKTAMKGLIAGLLAVILALSLLSWQTFELARQANKSAQAANREKNAADAEAKASKAYQTEAEKLVEAARRDAQILNEKLAELTARQQSLDALTGVLRRQFTEGRIRLDEVPPDLAMDLIRGPALNTQPASRDDIGTGYDPGFLGREIALPVLGIANLRQAVDGGREVPYLNYSVVLNAPRRMAVFAAANMDRRQRRVLPVLPDGLLPDLRLASRLQPDPAWFDRGAVWPGTLVGGREIAFGPRLDGDEAQAARRVANAVSVFPNLVPQFLSFNRGIWAGIDQWVLTDHNPTAARVSVFTGPVLADTDPVVDGVRMPRGFWKVAVSVAGTGPKEQAGARPDTAPDPGGEPGPELVVDAFLVLQFRAGSDAPLLSSTDAGPGSALRYRVPLSKIERLAGLRFDPAIQAADPLAMALDDSPGDAPGDDPLIGRVRGLDGPNSSQRRALAQQIVAALRDPDYPQQGALMAALLDMAQDGAMQALSATGRLNLLFVLSQVPAPRWIQPDRADLLDRALAAVADLERRAKAGQTIIGDKTQGHLDLLRANLGLDRAAAQPVYFQFAGMTRETAVGLSRSLQGLGWQIPGEERTGAAAGINEVRFNPAHPGDRLSAARLAADLRAAGQTGLKGAVENPQIKPGTLEIWISQ